MKICAICHQDCSDTPRFKTDLGEYVHQSCYEEQSTLGNELSDVPVQSNDTDKLGWDWFHYCLHCNRPWEFEKLEVRQRWVREAVNPHDHTGTTRYHKVLKDFYHCKKCGTEARSGDHGMGKLADFLFPLLLFTLGCQIFLFSHFLGYDLRSEDDLTRNSWSFVLVLFSIIWATQRFVIAPKFNKQLMEIHAEWVRQYGIDPKNWPNTYEK